MYHYRQCGFILDQHQATLGCAGWTCQFGSFIFLICKCFLSGAASGAAQQHTWLTWCSTGFSTVAHGAGYTWLTWCSIWYITAAHGAWHTWLTWCSTWFSIVAHGAGYTWSPWSSIGCITAAHFARNTWLAWCSTWSISAADCAGHSGVTYRLLNQVHCLELSCTALI